MSAEQYGRHRDRNRDNQLIKSTSGRDIGPIPDVVNPDRRASCKYNLQLYLETYHPTQFAKRWSKDHIKAIKAIEDTALRGGRFALAMPRGNGKTTLCRFAALWALLYGHHSFLLLIAATNPLAKRLLENTKKELRFNALLAEDFPEVCHPIICLAGIPNRCAGQICNGKPTCIEWTKNYVVLPTVEGSAASGAMLWCCGLTGAVRGVQHQRLRDDGTSETIRPTLVLLDDPQTKKSAKSFDQCNERMELIENDVLKCAGPGVRIAVFMTCTVIRRGDLADMCLEDAQWHPVRCKLLYEFPERLDLWEQYDLLRRDDIRMGDRDHRTATEFLRANYADMHAGSSVGWAERFEPHQISALQFAMDEWLSNSAMFACEFQNDPEPESDQIDDRISEHDIPLQQHPQKRGIAPLMSTLVTAFIDVQKRAMFWVVVAWAPDGSGFVLDYGVWPEQNQRFETYAKLQTTLDHKYPGKGKDAALRAGLDDLIATLLNRPWKREDGAPLTIDLALVDTGYEATLIKRAIRESPYKSRLIASKGFGVMAKHRPMGETPKTGEKNGDGYVSKFDSTHKVQTVNIDTNYWKTQTDARLSTSFGDPGALTLWKDQPARHELFASHCRAEPRQLIQAMNTGRMVYEYGEALGRDNHWWDGAVGNVVAADMKGIKVSDGGIAVAEQRKLSVADRQRQRLKCTNPVNAPGTLTPPTSPASEVAASAGGKKLSVAERQRLRREGRS